MQRLAHERLVNLGGGRCRIGDLSRASRPSQPPIGPWAAQRLVPSAQRSPEPGESAPGGQGQ